MREEPRPRRPDHDDHEERQPKGVEATVRLDLLVRQVMAERRARLTVEDASQRAARDEQGAEGEAG